MVWNGSGFQTPDLTFFMSAANGVSVFAQGIKIK
jgi:hypothetical protein